MWYDCNCVLTELMQCLQNWSTHALLDCWIWEILTFAMMCENVFKLKTKEKILHFCKIMTSNIRIWGILGSFSSDVKEGW